MRRRPHDEGNVISGLVTYVSPDSEVSFSSGKY